MAGFRAFHLLGYRVRVQPREELLGIHQPRGDQLRRDPDPWLQVPRHNPLPAKGKGLDSNEPMAATRVTEGKPAEATSGRGPPAWRAPDRRLDGRVRRGWSGPVATPRRRRRG